MSSSLAIAKKYGIAVVNTVLSKKTIETIKTLKAMKGETKLLKDKLLNPDGPLIAFCAKGFDRVKFCSQFIKDVVIVSTTGNVGPLAITLTQSAPELFAFLHEVAIPLLEELKSEGHPHFYNNTNKALNATLQVSLNDIKTMKLSQFKSLVKSKLHDLHEFIAVETIKSLNAFNKASKELSLLKNKVLNRDSPMLPFCTKTLKRVQFCSTFAADIVASTGETGQDQLASVLSKSSPELFDFLKEVLIPIINELEQEGHPYFRDNINRELMKHLGITLSQVETMSLKSFKKIVKSKMNHIKAIVELKGNQIGGGKSMELAEIELNEMTCKDLVDIAKHLNVPSSGSKKDIIDRILFVM